jgi:hypothetical protein
MRMLTSAKNALARFVPHVRSAEPAKPGRRGVVEPGAACSVPRVATVVEA